MSRDFFVCDTYFAKVIKMVGSYNTCSFGIRHMWGNQRSLEWNYALFVPYCVTSWNRKICSCQKWHTDKKTQEIWLPTNCWHRFKNALCLARLCLGQKQYQTLYVFGVISHTRVKIQVQANLQNLCVLSLDLCIWFASRFAISKIGYLSSVQVCWVFRTMVLEGRHLEDKTTKTKFETIEK